MKRRLGAAADSPRGELLPTTSTVTVKSTNARTVSRGSASTPLFSWGRNCVVVLVFLLLGVGAMGMVRFVFATRLPYYIPTLRTNVSKAEWDHGSFIHIVKTRFMQEQGNLTALGEARLALFRVFCLTTMTQQTTQQFIWLIKVDPDLHPRILRPLVHLVQPYDNIYIVASNTNFRVNEKFPGAWRDGAEIQDVASSKVYTGNQTRLQVAMALQKDYPILETRLDADDGLHVKFLHVVQETARAAWKEHSQLQWMYWCSRRHLDWHWMDAQSLHRTTPLKPSLSASLQESMFTHGVWQGVTHSKLCVTPGITTGYAVGTREHDVPVFAHDELVKKLQGDDHTATDSIPGCGLTRTADCLQFIESMVFEAVRSRSPTSAGMLNVQPSPHDLYDEWWVHFAFVNMAHESFGLSQSTLQWINTYLSDHVLEIANDNLAGQCTTGHSCKESAKHDLERLVASRRNTTVSDTDALAAH